VEDHPGDHSAIELPGRSGDRELV